MQSFNFGLRIGTCLIWLCVSTLEGCLFCFQIIIQLLLQLQFLAKDVLKGVASVKKLFFEILCWQEQIGAVLVTTHLHRPLSPGQLHHDFFNANGFTFFNYGQDNLFGFVAFDLIDETNRSFFHLHIVFIHRACLCLQVFHIIPSLFDAFDVAI